MNLRLGISPLSWVNEVIAEFGADTTADTCLSEAAAAGFAGVELSRVFPKDPAELRNLLSGYGLSLASGWHSGFLADRSVGEELVAVHDHATLLQACGASVMVYGECGWMPDDALDIPMSKRCRLSDAEWAGYGRRLSRFANALHARYGLRLAYHHHLMMIAETLDELRFVMRHSDTSVGLLLDTGHAFAAGFDYATVLDEFPDRIAHIHLKDVRANALHEVRSKNLSFNQAVRMGMFTIPGDGVVDFAPLSRFLATGRYKGWLLVEAEQDPSLAPPAKTATRAYAYTAAKILPVTVPMG